jgi:hypothetical protein
MSSFLGWFFGRKQRRIQPDYAPIQEAETEMHKALTREAEARTRLINSATYEKAQARRIVSAAEQAIRAAQWPWEKQDDETSY